MKRIFRPISILVVALIAFWYLYAHGEEFLLLKQFEISYLPLLLLFAISSAGVNGLILQFLVRQFSVNLVFREWFGLTTLHAFANYLPIPQVGTIARGFYLNKVHGLAYSVFAGIILVIYVLFLTTLGGAGLLSFSVLTWLSVPIPWPLWGLFFCLPFAMIALSRAIWSFPFLKRWGSVVENFMLLRKWHILLPVALKQMLLIIIACMGFWLAFRSLGRPVTLTASVILGLVTVASGIINVTPGNLGVAESAAWITAYLIKSDGDEAVVAYTVLRLITMLTVFTLTPYYLSSLTARTKSIVSRVEPEDTGSAV